MKLRLSILARLLGAIALLLTAAESISAHGIGVPQVINVPSGPYLISVWTDPDPLREDETHVVVAVMDPETRAPLVNNVAVSVRMEQPGDTASIVTAPALSDNSANQLLYVVVFNDRVSSGQWQATVIVDGPLGTVSDVSFPLEITAARGFNWLWLGLAGLLIAVVGWLVMASRKPAQEPAPKRRRARSTAETHW